MEKASTFMRELVIAVGGNLGPTENRKAWLSRVAETAGLHYRVVRAVWHGEQISLETARKLKAAAEKKQNEARNTAARLESLAARLEALDPEFHRQDIDALLALARRNRSLAGGAE